MSTSTIETRDVGAVRVLTLNRPRKKNAFNVALASDLAGALRDAERDSEIRVVVVTGSGAAFSSGADVSLFLGKGADSDRPPEQVTSPAQVHDVLRECHKPLVAAVNGVAIGMGVTLLPHFDLVYAGESASFQTPFVRLGLVLELGSSYSLPRLIGRQRANEMILTARTIDASTAERWGLVARIFPDEKLMSEVLALATDIADNPPTGVARCKELLLAGEERTGWQQCVAAENEVLSRCYGSEENMAAVMKFLESRRKVAAAGSRGDP